MTEDTRQRHLLAGRESPSRRLAGGGERRGAARVNAVLRQAIANDPGDTGEHRVRRRHAGRGREGSDHRDTDLVNRVEHESHGLASVARSGVPNIRNAALRWDLSHLVRLDFDRRRSP
ncbi:hypothetical protein [Xylanimonas ulmi]